MNLGALGTHASGKGGSDFCALLLKSRCASHHPSRRPHRWSRDLGLRLGPAGGFLRTSRPGPELPRSSRRFKRLSESLLLHSESEVRARRATRARPAHRTAHLSRKRIPKVRVALARARSPAGYGAPLLGATVGPRGLGGRPRSLRASTTPPRVCPPYAPPLVPPATSTP